MWDLVVCIILYIWLTYQQIIHRPTQLQNIKTQYEKAQINAPRLTQYEDTEREQINAPRLTQYEDTETEQINAPRLTQYEDKEREQKNTPRLTQYEDTETEQINTPRLTQYEDTEREQINAPLKSLSDCSVRKKRGKVPTLEYKVLQKHRVEMIQLLEPSRVIVHLYRNGVIDKDDVEKIEQKCKDLRIRGAEAMLNIIYNSGNWAFQKLLEALNHAAYKDMAKKLKGDLEKKKKDPNSDSETSKQRGRMSAIESAVLQDNHERLVNELDSSILKNHLFENELINEDELEEITKKEEKLRKNGVEEMIKIIYKSGANAFPKLVKSLEKAGYEDLSWKLKSDLTQKKEKNHKGQKMDLSLVTFPEYPHHFYDVKYDAIQGDNVSKKLIVEFSKMWYKSEEQWFNSMCTWFNNHDFSSKEVLKLVAKDWLVTMEGVTERGCLEVNLINYFMDVTDRVKDDDYFEWLKFIRSNYLSDSKNEMSREDLINALKKDREEFHEYERGAINQIKHNLEVIIGEKIGDIKPIYTSKCDLGHFLHSVGRDVRNIWEKLP